MRHYEIVLMFHPDQSEHVPEVIEKYKEKMVQDESKVHRQEDWGRRPLSYPIAGAHKAHYVLLNVEIGATVLDELKLSFRYNNLILRYILIRMDQAIAEPSILAKTKVTKEGQEIREKRENVRRRRLDIDYKDVGALKVCITETGKIVPRRITNMAMQEQRRFSKAIKRARYLAFLPYCDNHK